MKKFKKKTEDNVISDLFDDIMDETPQETEEKKPEEEEEFNPNSYEIVIDRVQHGLVGTLKIINDNTNKPIFKDGDFVHFIAPARLEKKDFVLYQSHDNYFIRRIIKFVGEDIYVAGDNEKEYHIIHKEDVIGKAIGRQRKKKYISFALNPSKKFYTFKKVKLAKLRLGNRVMNYDGDMSQESYEIAMQNIEANTNISAQNAQKQQAPQYQIASDIDLDSELASFLNPDDLVREIRNQAAETGEEVIGERIVNDENLYVESVLGEVTDTAEGEEEVEYVEESDEGAEEAEEYEEEIEEEE